MTFIIVATVAGFLFVFSMDMFLHLFACLEAKKAIYVEIRRVLHNGNKSALRRLCQKYPSKFAGYSRHYKVSGRAALAAFVAERMYA